MIETVDLLRATIVSRNSEIADLKEVIEGLEKVINDQNENLQNWRASDVAELKKTVEESQKFIECQERELGRWRARFKEFEPKGNEPSQWSATVAENYQLKKDNDRYKEENLQQAKELESLRHERDKEYALYDSKIIELESVIANQKIKIQDLGEEIGVNIRIIEDKQLVHDKKLEEVEFRKQHDLDDLKKQRDYLNCELLKLRDGFAKKLKAKESELESAKESMQRELESMNSLVENNLLEMSKLASDVHEWEMSADAWKFRHDQAQESIKQLQAEKDQLGQRIEDSWRAGAVSIGEIKLLKEQNEELLEQLRVEAFRPDTDKKLTLDHEMVFWQYGYLLQKLIEFCRNSYGVERTLELFRVCSHLTQCDVGQFFEAKEIILKMPDNPLHILRNFTRKPMTYLDTEL